MVDALHTRYNFGPWRSKFESLIAEGNVGGQKVLLVKPQTYYNETGRALSKILQFYKRPADDVTVFYDEIDLAPGKLRVKRGGGHAGHNGLRSIHAGIGPDYARVRMGVGHPGDKNLVKTYVLKDFAKADDEWLQPMVDGCAEFMDDLLKGDDPSYMSKVAHKISPNRPNAPRPGAADNEEA